MFCVGDPPAQNNLNYRIYIKLHLLTKNVKNNNERKRLHILDKIKLYTTDKSNINWSIINNNFEPVSNTYHNTNHNVKHTFKNDTTNITIDRYGITIKTNPTTYLKQTNICQINRKELILFKEKLENDLQINSNKFNLTGFDFNVDITTDYPPNTYFNSIRALPKYKQVIYPYSEGISFINNCKSFTFYDKLKELSKRNNEIPIEYLDQNLMRLEMCVERKMKQTKNLSQIETLEDLTCPDNYISTINEFENIYNKIHKQPTIKYYDMKRPDPAIICTDDFAKLYFINEIGMKEYLNQLQQEKDMGLLTYRKFKLRVDKATNLWDKYASTNDEKFDLLEEMNNKVYQKIEQLKEVANEDSH